jgi:hypothetical protein
MKKTIRIALALGLIAALFAAMNAGPAVAYDGFAEVRIPHPCSIAANYRRYWESEKEKLDRLEEIKNDAWSDYEEKQGLVDEVEAQIEELEAQILALELDIIDEFEDVPGWFLDESDANRLLPTSFANFVGARLDFYRNDPYHAHWATTEEEDRLEDLLNELWSLLDDHHDAEYDLYAAIWDRDAAYEVFDEADEKWRDELVDFGATEASYERAQRECNITRASMSVTDRLRDYQEQKSMTRFDRALLEQMQNPMGSDANQASVEGYLEIPFATQEQAQPSQAAAGQIAMPEMETATVTPSRARLFNNLPKRLTPGAVQSTPAATSQTMQVQQQESANTGSSSVGYTHMSVPQNAGQSGPAVAPQKSLKAMPAIRQMRMQPGRSLKP